MSDPMNRCILNFPEMDEQHRYLYELFDDIERSTQVTNPVTMKTLLAEIERYLLFHFNSEEYLMRMYDFSGFAIHQSDHEQAGVRFVQFVNMFNAGTLNPAALRMFLTGWLSEHSCISDTQYVEWVQTRRNELRTVLQQNADEDYLIE